MTPRSRSQSHGSFSRPFATQVMEFQTRYGRGDLETIPEITPGKAPKKHHSGHVGFIAETFIVVILGVVLALGLHLFVTQVYAISGQSMEPTLHNGERVVISRLTPGLLELEHGDLVIFSSPRQPNKNLIKRVIGLAGDEISIEDGVVYRNGQPLAEEYANHDSSYARRYGSVEVPPGQVFVMGDNRPQSQDSRDFGNISIETIKGTVFMRLWPLDSFSLFP